MDGLLDAIEAGRKKLQDAKGKAIKLRAAVADLLPIVGELRDALDQAIRKLDRPTLAALFAEFGCLRLFQVRYLLQQTAADLPQDDPRIAESYLLVDRDAVKSFLSVFPCYLCGSSFFSVLGLIAKGGSGYQPKRSAS